MNKSTWHENNKDKLRGYARKYREKDPERYKANQRAHYAKHRDRRLAEQRENYHKKWPQHLRKKYGLAQTDFEGMLAAQGGCCAICAAEKPGGRYARFHVDHCHKSGKVRQLLCNACNHMLGCARDNPSVLRAAAGYLERHQVPVLTCPEKSS